MGQRCTWEAQRRDVFLKFRVFPSGISIQSTTRVLKTSVAGYVHETGLVGPWIVLMV